MGTGPHAEDLSDLEPSPSPHPSGCGKMWDNLTCWPATPWGQVVVLPCPLIFNIFSSIEGKRPGVKKWDAGEHKETLIRVGTLEREAGVKEDGQMG